MSNDTPFRIALAALLVGVAMAIVPQDQCHRDLSDALQTPLIVSAAGRLRPSGATRKCYALGKPNKILVGREGLEPPTPGLKARAFCPLALIFQGFPRGRLASGRCRGGAGVEDRRHRLRGLLLHSLKDMRVRPERECRRRMAEAFLHDLDGDATLKEIRSMRVPQVVERPAPREAEVRADGP